VILLGVPGNARPPPPHAPPPPCAGVIENNVSTAISTFARVRVNAHTDAQTRFVIADRSQTIAWAFTLSSRMSIWRFMAIWPSVETLFSIPPLPGAAF